jgi:hypothetical protein
MILIQVVCSEMAHESESSDEDGLSQGLSDNDCDNDCEGLISDKSSDNGIALGSASEVKEGGNMGSNGKQYIEDLFYQLMYW